MPIERAPRDPLPVDFVPQGAATTHRIRDGDNWASVAGKFSVDAKKLIFFNFKTNHPDEVNWYLRRNVGCNVSNDGGLNWAFSSSADPGIVYIPPSVIDMEEIVVEGDTQTLMERLKKVAKTLTGNEGTRVRELLDIATRVGSPADEQLWYYNGGAVFKYIQLRTENSERKEMTTATNGSFPFDGDAGANFGRWKITPFQDVRELNAANRQSDSDLRTWLLFLDGQIQTSWLDMVRIHDVGGGTTEGLVAEFLDHVTELAKGQDHLYFVYQRH